MCSPRLSGPSGGSKGDRAVLTTIWWRVLADFIAAADNYRVNLGIWTLVLQNATPAKKLRSQYGLRYVCKL